MNNVIKIALVSLLAYQPSAFSGSLISAGMINDFENGEVMNWENGGRRQSPNKPKVVTDADSGNKYLEVVSLGGKKGEQSISNARMTVSNATYSIAKGEYDFNDQSGHPSKWAGDYSEILKIEGKAMATSDTESTLYLRLGLGDYRDDAKVYFTSKKAVELNTDGSWTDFSFELKSENFVDQGLYGVFNTEFTFDRLIKDVPHIRFVSNQENTFYGGDRIKAKLGLDDIKAVGRKKDGDISKMECVASYQLDGSLYIPCVSVPFGADNTVMYGANLKADPSSETLSFKLLNAEKK